MGGGTCGASADMAVEAAGAIQQERMVSLKPSRKPKLSLLLAASVAELNCATDAGRAPSGAMRAAAPDFDGSFE